MLLDAKAKCQSCGRYIGADDICPYCDCDAYFSLKSIRLILFIGAIIGVIVLSLFVTSSRPKRVLISDIIPSMNYSLISVSGKVSSKRYIKKADKKQYYSFYIVENKIKLKVIAYNDVAKKLENKGIKRGDTVSVIGYLRVNRGQKYILIISNEEDVNVDR